MSKDGSKEMSKAADSLTIFVEESSEDGTEQAQTKPQVNKNEPKAGSFEKLTMLFGRPGTIRPG